MNLAKCIDRPIKKRDSLRAVARAAGLDASYISRLRSDDKDQPSDRILEALGLERVVSYRVSRRASNPIPKMSRANAAAYHGIEDDGL